MADKAKKKTKPKKDEQGVLAALPSKRPERIGGRRDAAAAKRAATAGAGAPAKPVAEPATVAAKPARAKPKRTSAAAKPARAKRAPAKRSSRPTASRRKAAAPHTFEPTQAAEAAAGAIPRAEQRPQPVREGAPGIGTAGQRDERSAESGRPSGADLAGTAVRAAGEVAQLGLTIGGEVLKRVVRRLPL